MNEDILVKRYETHAIDPIKIFDGYLNRKDWRVKENASTAFSLGAFQNYMSGAMTASFWLNEIYPKYSHDKKYSEVFRMPNGEIDDQAISNAHRNCDYHIHDLCNYSAYCNGLSLRQLIETGIIGINSNAESGPAKHLSSIVQQMCNFIGIHSNEFAGAQSFSSMDTYLAPYIKKDNMEYGAIKQCMQALLHNLNMPSRWATQPPFSNITLDFVCPDDLINQNSKIGGKKMSFTFGDCAEEQLILCRAFLEAYIEGDAKGAGFQYPIITVNVTKDFNEKVPLDLQELLFGLASRYGSPYFSNFISSDLDPSSVRSMCLHPDTLIEVKLEEDLLEDTETGEWFSLKEEGEKSSTRRLHSKNEECQIPIKYNFQYKIKTPFEGYQNFIEKQEIDFNGNLLKIEFDDTDKFLLLTPDHRSEILFHGHLIDTLTKNVKVGDPMMTSNNKILLVTKITEVPYRGKVYDFTLKGHLFYANNILTHNCCRLRLNTKEMDDFNARMSAGGVGGAREKTGSIGVVTLSLPKIGYLAKNEDDLFGRLAKLMDIAAASLAIKREVLNQELKRGLYPYTKRYLGGWQNHFSTIGFVGLNEMCVNFLGKDKDLTTEEGNQFGQKVLQYMKNRKNEYSKKYRQLYNLEATPAESTAGRLARHNKEQYPEIFAQGTDDSNWYYTNSMWLPVNSSVIKEDVWKSLDLEDPLQTIPDGGVVQHIFLGEEIKDWRKTKDFIFKVFKNYRLPYLTISPKYSVAKNCGHGFFTGDTHGVCPICRQQQLEEYQNQLNRLEKLLAEAEE